MPLRFKFAALLCLLGAAVVVALGIAWWSLDTMQRETREPVRGMSEALEHLGLAKRAIEDAASTISGAPPGEATRGVRPPIRADAAPPTPAQLTAAYALADRAFSSLRVINEHDVAFNRVGRRTLANMQERLQQAFPIGSRQPSMDAEQRNRVTASLFELHEIIERTEAKIVGDTKEALAHGADVRQRLGVVLAVVLLLTALTIALGMSLVRRWVVVPVQRLRAATARFAAGDLSYRISAGPAGRDELAQLSHEFDHMAGTIRTLQDERVERERLAAIGEMVRRLAHNLRNPLGGIRSLAELSRTDIAAGSVNLGEIRDHQNRIIQTVDRFERWVADLLNVTRPAQVQPIVTQVVPWITDLVEAHRPAANARGIQLLLDVERAPATAAFDPRHLDHAVSALISNAAEAMDSSKPGNDGPTPHPPKVVVSLRRCDSHWEIWVADTGKGIPPDLRQQIFAPYFTTKRDGTGIGLALALQVVRAHGGQIELAEPGKGLPGYPGACFVVRLPDQGAQGAQVEPGELASIGLPGANSGQNTRH